VIAAVRWTNSDLNVILLSRRRRVDMFPRLGAPELAILLAIIVLIFGVGRLPEVGSAVGKSIREFRKSSTEPGESETDVATGTGKTTQEKKAG
jgi:sec-independent protein translocase protein TatA